MSGSVSSSDRDDDTSLSLCDLRRRTGKPLLHSVVDIYKAYKIWNDKSIQFWKYLRCYLPQNLDTGGGFQNPRPSVQIPLELHSPGKGFVALSYRWEPAEGESDKKKKYRIASKMEEELKVRDIVLDRTFRFIRYNQARGAMLPLWIDKLSIDQENTSERETAMQSMDLVYKKCAYAVGYLWTQLQSQTEMNRLSDLLSGRIVGRKLVEGNPILLKGIDTKIVSEVLDVLTIITNDVWWTRAWIFQEDYLAGRRMWLIIRHASGLRKPLVHNKLGWLRGEVVVRSDELKTYATLFCLACRNAMRKHPGIVKQSTEILKKVAKYNILYKYHQYAKAVDAKESMTIKILKDLDDRESKYRTDLLPIVANVCAYDVRIATTEKGFKKKSLSLSILALCIANGELLANFRGADQLKHNVFNFLGENSLRICAPLPDGELTLIKHCRLSVHHLSLAGIHTTGVLWRLGDVISPQCIPESSCVTPKSSSQRDVFRNGLDDYQRDRLIDLLGVLKKRQRRNKRRYQSISDDLQAYLEYTGPSPTHDDWPTQHSMNAMASSIVDAMDTGKYLQLAYPIGGSLDSGRGIYYRAILVRDRDDLRSAGSTYVFTSWSRTNEHIKGIMETRKIAKYVSIIVDVDEELGNRTVRLESKTWINGLCFFDGEKKFPFVFKWPDSLSE